jgi:pimeloyl-ACP methyl ester carboxylesterase
MAGDTTGLIDTLGLSPAYVVGHSMGGMIAQRIATGFPDRVRSLTLFGTNPCDGMSGQSSPEFLALAAQPPSGDPVEDRETTLTAYRICVEPDPVDDAALTALFQSQADRAPNPFMQCIPAVIASTIAGTSSSPTHGERLESLEMPTLVLHGTGDLPLHSMEARDRPN